MVPGFKKRLLQEIKSQMTENDEFESLKKVADYVCIPDSVFAPNINAWVGAALQMSLGQDVDRFLTTFEQFEAEGGLRDRFGDAYLTFNREGDHFNKNWELNFKYQKEVLYTSDSPITSKSFAAK